MATGHSSDSLSSASDTVTTTATGHRSGGTQKPRAIRAQTRAQPRPLPQATAAAAIPPRSCSHDDGQTWPEDERLVVHVHDEKAAISQGREEIDYAEFWEDMGKWSFGHPAIRPLENGWLLAWYSGTPDRMSIHWAHVAEDV